MTVLPPLSATLQLWVKGWRRSRRLWLPLFLVWLLLLPLLILLLPLFVVWALILGLNPARTLGLLIGLLGATRGTRLEVDNPNARLVFHLH